MSEYIYCLKNDAMPGLYKLGFSKNLYQRLDSLFTTGVPMMFECIYLKSVNSMKAAEAFLFIELDKYRFNSNREFFKLDIELIKEAFDKIDGIYIDVDKFNKYHSIKHSKNKIIKEENQYESITNNDDDDDINDDDYDYDDNDDDHNNFKCKRCDIIFSSKPRLKTHLQKITPCKFVRIDFNRQKLIDKLYQKKLNDKTFDCEFCGAKFNMSSGKSHHKKICKKKPQEPLDLLFEINSLKTIVNSLVEDNKILKAKVNKKS
jgi:hypothetical protein